MHDCDIIYTNEKNYVKRGFVMVTLLNAVPGGQIAAVVVLAIFAVLIWTFFGLSFTKIPFMQKLFGKKSEEGAAESGKNGENKPAKEEVVRDKHIYIHHVYEDDSAHGEAAGAAAPAAAPASEPTPAPAPEPAPAPAAKKKPVVEDDDDDDDDDREYGVIMVDDKPVKVAYRKSFQARLIESTDELKNYYCQIANHVLAYRLKGRVSWGYLSFNKGKDPFCKFNVEMKTLCVYFALNYKEFKESEEYNVEKAKTKKFEKTPVMMRITSNKSLKSAMDLIDLMAERVELKKGSAVNVEKIEKYPLDTKENLIARGLIKYTVIEGDPNTL